MPLRPHRLAPAIQQHGIAAEHICALMVFDAAVFLRFPVSKRRPRRSIVDIPAVGELPAQGDAVGGIVRSILVPFGQEGLILWLFRFRSPPASPL